MVIYSCLRGDEMKAKIRLTIIKEEKFMGPGTKVLLEKINEFSSIKEASISMGMSYSKCLRMLKTMEKELGFAVVISEKGGINRGGTRLTDEGKKTLKIFTEIEQNVIEYSQKLVDQKFIL